MRVTPREAQRILEAMSQRLASNLERAETKNIRLAQRLLVARSQGTLSAAQARRMGHPYAKRDPQTPVDPSVINRQTGTFARSWTVLAPQTDGSVLTSRVRNLAAYSGYMRGTRYMVPRPIVEAVQEELAPVRAENVRKAVQQAIKPRGARS